MIRNKACVHADPYEKEIAVTFFQLHNCRKYPYIRTFIRQNATHKLEFRRNRRREIPRIKTSKANLKVIMNDKTPATSDTTTGEVEKPLDTFDCKLDTIAKSPT